MRLVESYLSAVGILRILKILCGFRVGMNVHDYYLLISFIRSLLC